MFRFVQCSIERRRAFRRLAYAIQMDKDTMVFAFQIDDVTFFLFVVRQYPLMALFTFPPCQELPSSTASKGNVPFPNREYPVQWECTSDHVQQAGTDYIRRINCTLHYCGNCSNWEKQCSRKNYLCWHPATVPYSKTHKYDWYGLKVLYHGTISSLSLR